MSKKIFTPITLFLILIIGVLSIIIAQKIYELRKQPIAPNVPQSMPEAVDNGSPSQACTLNITIGQVPTNTPIPLPPNTPTPGGPTTTPKPDPSCGETCDPNNNKCKSDARYCIDYEGDSKGPICGRQTLAGQGPKCEAPPLGCGDVCDPNNNKCPSDATYCIDYEGDGKGPICGRQTLAGQGPKCTLPQPSCGESCDLNNNKCQSDAPYCVDYTTDNLGAICGRQPIAGQSPNCTAPTPVPMEIPAVGTVENTIFAIAGGIILLGLGLIFL